MLNQGKKNQFDISDGYNFGLPYDCASVMHYSKNTFGIKQRETMTPIHPDCHLASSAQEWENTSPMLSPGDVEAISRLYHCPSSKQSPSPTVCAVQFATKEIGYFDH